MGVIRIRRSNDWYGRLLSIYVFLDDKEIGKVDFEQDEEFIVPDGIYGQLYVKLELDGTKSKVQKNIKVGKEPVIFLVKMPSSFNPFSVFFPSITLEAVSKDHKALE